MMATRGLDPRKLNIGYCGKKNYSEAFLACVETGTSCSLKLLKYLKYDIAMSRRT